MFVTFRSHEVARFIYSAYIQTTHSTGFPSRVDHLFPFSITTDFFLSRCKALFRNDRNDVIPSLQCQLFDNFVSKCDIKYSLDHFETDQISFFVTLK